jgi:hypothetical protein
LARHDCIVGLRVREVKSVAVRRVVLPIRLGIDAMERLLIAGLNGDPEFEAIEPQVFDATQTVAGCGMRVLRHGVKVNLERYAFDTGIAELVETTIGTPADLCWHMAQHVAAPKRKAVRRSLVDYGSWPARAGHRMDSTGR